MSLLLWEERHSMNIHCGFFVTSCAYTYTACTLLWIIAHNRTSVLICVHYILLIKFMLHDFCCYLPLIHYILYCSYQKPMEFFFMHKHCFFSMYMTFFSVCFNWFDLCHFQIDVLAHLSSIKSSTCWQTAIFSFIYWLSFEYWGW